jgi:hypothetical protein
MAQRIFTESFVNSLSSKLRKNPDKETLSLVREIPLKFNDSDVILIDHFPDLSRVALANQSSGRDFEFRNAISIYESLRITPYEASNPSLWSFLALVTFRSYTAERSRFPDDKIEAGDYEAAGTFIMRHYLCAGSSLGALLLNDISLLWWGAHLTVQEEKSGLERYKLTKEVFAHLDYTRILFGVQGRSASFRHAVLEFVVENPELFKSKHDAKVRFIMRRLNTLGGYQLFSFYSKIEIKALIETFRQDIVEERIDD